MIQALYRFTSKHRAVTLVVVVLLWGLMGMLASKISIQEDISKTFPKDSVLQKYQDFYQRSPLASKVIVALSADGNGGKEAISLGYSFLDSVNVDAFGLIDSVEFEMGGFKLESSLQYFYSELPYFLSTEEQDSLITNQDSLSVKVNIESVLAKLSSPEGYALRRYLVRDPAGMYGTVLSKLSGFKESGQFRLEDGHLFTEDGRYVLIFITPSFPASESRNNSFLIEHLQDAADKLDGEVLFFGGPVIAAANATQMRRDATIAGSIAVFVILGLLLWYYRKLVMPIVFFLPPLFGIVLALAAIYLIKGQISLITIGAGSIVLGIALDYCFHALTHIKHSGSIGAALNDIAWPLTLSCFTTVLAFLSLLFLKSEILGDFGLLASFSLIGTLFFVLIVLPHVVDLLHLDKKMSGSAHWLDRKFSGPRFSPFFTILTIGGITVFLCFHLDKVSFEGDLNKINYFPEELQKAEQAITVSQSQEKTLFVVTEGRSVQEGIDKNHEVTQALDSLKSEKLINSAVSLNQFVPTSKEARERAMHWNELRAKRDHFETMYRKAGVKMGVKENGFGEFYSVLRDDVSTDYYLPDSILSNPLFANLVLFGGEGVSVINAVNVHPDNLKAVMDFFEGGVGQVVDKSAMAGSLISVVKDNFNLLLIITSSLVFIALLLNYGRIELALLTFLPMVVSWLWILGLCGLLGIKFNFVNVIITTFIFGLGDDFCIFVSDGLLSRFKLGVNRLQSYRSSIVLSTTTTIIGTGVLLFAKHPALYSIAALSVIGMLCISFISLTLQPVVFDYIAQRRKEKGLPPLTLFIFLSSLFSFSYFALGSIFMSLLIPLFWMLPAPVKGKKKVYSYLISKFAGSVFYTAPHIKRKTLKGGERFDKPAIIVANHQSFLDILAMLELKPGTVILTKEWVWKSPLFGWVVRYAGFPTAVNNLEDNEDHIAHCLSKGRSVVVFPEGTRTVDGSIKRFHKGAFYLAEKYQVDIVPIVLHGFKDVIPKGGLTIWPRKLSLKVLPRIKPKDTKYGSGYRERAKLVASYIREEYKKMVIQEEDVSYHHWNVISNYIYKGPILEWYVRVKMWFEKDFRVFEEQVPKVGRIVDLGCGYGYLSYMLAFTGNEREVEGLDYDKSKIEVAANGYAKTAKLHFDVCNLLDYKPESADAFIIKDVMHYLPSEKQLPLLESCCQMLRPGGVIVLRDGFVENEGHSGTRLTELFSTRLFGFNKTENELSFMSKSSISKVSQKYGMNIAEMQKDSGTSNQILILRKPKNE